MKFVKKALAAAALIGVSATLLTGCGSKVVGKWEVKEITVSGQTYKDDDDINGIPTAGIIQMEFKDGGKAEVSALGQKSEETEWKEDGNKIILSDKDSEDDDQTMEFEIDGDEMKLTKSPTDEFGEGLVMKKVDSFTKVDLDALGGGDDDNEDDADEE